MRVLSIDPGSTRSGWVLLEGGVPVRWGWDENREVQKNLYDSDGATRLVIEDVGHYGMAVGRDVFETVKWMGRFETAFDFSGALVSYIPRPTVKTHLCGVASAKDANVRQALIDRFGGQEKAIGGKKCPTCKGKGWVGRGRPACLDCHCRNWGHDPATPDGFFSSMACGYATPPGPLHGITAHVWSALAVGVTYLDTKEERDDS